MLRSQSNLVSSVLLLGCVLSCVSAQCSFFGQKAYPTPEYNAATASCVTVVFLGSNQDYRMPTLTGNNSFPLFQIGTPWAFAVWVNPSTSAGPSLSVLTEQADYASDCHDEILSLHIDGPNTEHAGSPSISQCGTGSIRFAGTVIFGVWNHLVYQYDGRSTFQVYLNGINLPVAANSAAFTPVARYPSVVSVYLNAPGESGSLTSVFGQLTTLRVYSQPLNTCGAYSDLLGFRQAFLVAEYASQFYEIALFDLKLTDALVLTNPTAFSCNLDTHCTI